MTSSAHLITELRLKLSANGYSPIPVTSPDPNDAQAGKKPAIGDWANSVARTSGEIAAWEHRYPYAGNTGLVCGRLVAVDIDVDDENAVERIQEAVFDSIGLDAPVRIGRAPRALILCRTKAPIKKRASKEFVLPNGLVAKVEILGKGQQCVVDGIHPKTNSAYLWKGRSPMTMAFSDLPEVDEGQLSAVIARSEDILRDIGAQPRDAIVKQEAVGKERARRSSGPIDLALVSEALEFIPNEDADYEFWLRIGFALHHGLSEQGFKLWNGWSKKSKKHDERFTLKTWSYFKRGGGVTINSLFYYASQNGWREKLQDRDKPIVCVMAGRLHEAVDAAEQALLDSSIEVFQRGGVLVRPIRAPITDSLKGRKENLRLITICEDWLNETFTRVALFQKVKGETGELTTINCPSAIVKAYLARAGEWRVPILKGLVHGPTMRGDGTIIATPGYDPKSNLYADFDTAAFPPLPETSDRGEAMKALASLKELFSTFPFVSDADRSVAIATILTGVVRHLFPTAPLFGYSAPVAGSGKSLLVDLTSIIVTGQPAAVLSPGKTQEELEKRLAAALIQGCSIVSLDNCTGTIFGAFLCQVITQSRVQTRILGQSKNVEVLTNVLMLATGNNLTFTEDMTRRVLLCSLDPEMERPEERQFEKDIIHEALSNRGLILIHILTILQAFFRAGRPQAIKTLGSFSDWSRVVPAALVWLGEANPLSTIENVRDNDPVLARIQTLLTEIDLIFGPRPFSVAELISEARNRSNGSMGGYVYANAELHQILSEFSGGKESLDASRIGKELWRLNGRRFGYMMLEKQNGRAGKRLWRLVGGVHKGLLNIL